MEAFMIDFTLASSIMTRLLYGATVSLKIAFISFCIGALGGTFFGIALTRGSALVRYLVTAIVTVVRGTPMLVQIVFLYTILSPLQVSAFVAAVIAIGFNSSAYVSQIIKAGIDSVGTGQLEAAQLLGIGNYDTMRYIVLPQALRTVLPALGNEIITLIKDSSLASLVGVVELYKEGQTIISQTYDALTVFFAMALVYLLMTSTAAYLVGRLERRLNYKVRS